MRLLLARMLFRSQSVILSLGVCGLLGVSPADARITRLAITRVESPTFGGRSFGSVGRYEKIVARAFGEVDPADPRNAVIVDINRAPRNARGLVEYDTDILLLKPVDLPRGNHRLWYEPTNRGTIQAYAQFNDVGTGTNDPAAPADAGNGFLMREGYTVLLSGWDFSAPPGGGRFTTRVPVAVNPDGSPIVGRSLEEFVVDDSRTLVGPLTYPPATLDRSRARLAVRARYDDAPVDVDTTQWEFLGSDGRAIRLVPAGTPFQAGMLYTFTYDATRPLVAGLGLAAIRDLAAFFRGAAKDDAATPNPLAGDVRHVLAACFSQPCRALHDFVRLGFNEDERGRQAIDGIVHWTGGSTGNFLNYRFAQPGRTHRQHIGRWYPEFQGPFANQAIDDAVAGTHAGRLDRCAATHTCPKIFEVNSANEYWSKNMAVGYVDARGVDLPPEPASVRSYFLASLPHSAAFGPTDPGICQQPRNPLVANAVLRALLLAMDRWVSEGTPPPASRMPRVDEGTLVPPLPQARAGFPGIPNVTYNGRMHTGDHFDFGPRFADGILSTLPPRRSGTPYPALVPKADADGNDIAGIRLPDIAVPLATFTGWALRARPAGIDEGCDASGQRIAFARTRAERMAAGDPRLSIEERYPDRATYVEAVRAAAETLARERFLLEDDVRRYVLAAERGPFGR